MKVYLIWSGELSRAIAQAFKDWVPNVISNVELFFSKSDISAGTNWFQEISKQLESTNFGVIFLTKDSINAPWIFFETGALAKHISQASICTTLIDIQTTDIVGPLTQFQAITLNKEGMLALAKSINNSIDIQRLPDRMLSDLFEMKWQSFEEKINAIKISIKTVTTSQASLPKQTEKEVVDEILRLTRSMNQAMNQVLSYKKEELPKSDEHVKAQFLKAISTLKIKNRKMPCNLSLINDEILREDENFDVNKTSFGSFVKLAIYFEGKGVITLEKQNDHYYVKSINL
ncbi:MAG: toll/interleukin-1 receptor domain-containing protein [Ignavibacteriales bacterium]|nr:toll/interleukin-1 receptor domain-containing protein [Ignavibacteriales bacterium]